MGPNAAPQPVVSSSATVISVGEDGLTYIADGNTVLALDPFAGVTVPMFTPAASGTGLDAVGFIEGLHVTADGSMYISDSVFNRVVKWTPGGTTGELIAGWDGNGTSQDFGKGDGLGQLWAPRGLDMGADGALYVADVLNNRVMRYAGNGDGTFAAAGSIVAGGNGSGSNLNQLWSPYDVKVGVSGDLFISDTTNHRIVRVASNGDGTFAAAGTIAAGGNDTGFAANQVSDPQYIAVDAAEGVYYSSAKTGLVHHWAAGATEATLVYGGAELGRALGVDVDASGRAWALDFHYRGVVAQVIDAELSIATIPTGTLGDASVAVPLTQRNGADAQITTMTPAVCDIQFGRVRMLAVGTCTVKASKSGYLWTTAETTASFSIVAAPTTTTAPPTTTVPPTTVPPTTQAPTTTVPATTPPTTQAPTTTVPATTPPTTQAPTTTVPAVPSKALKATCKASGKSVKCTVSKPAGVAKATKVFYQAVCIAGTAVKSTSVRSAATKVTLTIKTTKGSWKCSLTAISGTSRWTKSASVKTR
jgi:sugar lactone lactonase YvrE